MAYYSLRPHGGGPAAPAPQAGCPAPCCTKSPVIESRWESTSLALAGKLRPRRLTSPSQKGGGAKRPAVPGGQSTCMHWPQCTNAASSGSRGLAPPQLPCPPRPFLSLSRFLKLAPRPVPPAHSSLSRIPHLLLETPPGIVSRSRWATPVDETQAGGMEELSPHLLNRAPRPPHHELCRCPRPLPQGLPRAPPHHTHTRTHSRHTSGHTMCDWVAVLAVHQRVLAAWTTTATQWHGRAAAIRSSHAARRASSAAPRESGPQRARMPRNPCQQRGPARQTRDSPACRGSATSASSPPPRRGMAGGRVRLWVAIIARRCERVSE
jgi:hypothetical protein